MKKTVLVFATAALLGSSALAMAGDTKIGILMDITGPIASFIPPIQNSSNLAVKNVNDQGGLLDGKAVAVYGDTTGSAQGAVDAAGKLVNVENVSVVMGALMSGTTIAAAEAVMIPAGVAQISPTATSPAITGIKDNDLLYRVVPSDNYQGAVLAKMVLDEGIKKVAVTYVNNDYGVGIGQTFIDAYKAAGGEIVAAEQTRREEELLPLRAGDACQGWRRSPGGGGLCGRLRLRQSSSRRSRADCSHASSAPTVSATRH